MKTKILMMLVVGVLSINANEAFGTIIVNNGDVGTSYTGAWSLSSGSEPYGDDSLWARDGATYTWEFDFDSLPAGNYEVLMWWSQWSTRATEIDVGINYDGNYDIVTINQQQNAGQWNSLGYYCFDSVASVTITAAYGDTVSTSADAVWVRNTETPEPATLLLLGLGAVIFSKKR